MCPDFCLKHIFDIPGELVVLRLPLFGGASLQTVLVESLVR